MKKTFLFAFAALLSLGAMAQDGFQFTTVKELPITPVKNQSRSSTCWCFSSMGFFESELLRMGKGTYDLSEMFVVSKTMLDRADNYVRLQGASSFGPGGSFYDAIYAFKYYGLVPQEVMPGIMYGDTIHNHNELDALAGGVVETASKLRKPTQFWKKTLEGVYETYLGKMPETFTYKGKQYTPKSFAASLGLNMDDYVNITSFTHHPFYETFAIEVQDNWRGGQAYNLPLDEMMQIFDYAINNGYTIAWGADVSETGFSRQTCVGVVPDVAATPDLTGSDMVRWTGLTEAEKRTESITRPGPELKITQEMRQEGYNNFETTDDHGMQIFGIAKDQTGKEYYMVKNSWGTSSKYKGIWYVSKAFVAYKTMNFVVNKNGIPKEIKAKLGIK